MKKKNISEAIGNINPKYIDEAGKYIPKAKSISRGWLKWGSLAACFAVLVIASFAILSSFFNGGNVNSGKYKYHVAGSEVNIEWPWEYKTNAEKYRNVMFNGKLYVIQSLNAVSTNNLGETLGSGEAEGVDFHTDKKYSKTFDVHKLNGVSADKLIAVGDDKTYYVYAIDESEKPSDFGEMLDSYGLNKTLDFDNFTKCEGYDEKGYFLLNNDEYIWQILSGCRDAQLDNQSDSFDVSNRDYLTFTVTSDTLGVYKSAVYISKDGYFATNILNYCCSYFIGADVAGKIIEYALNNSNEAEFSPYALTVSGTLTEIGKGYILIDDTVLCKNAKDGTIYKVYINDLRVIRCIECTSIKVGDTVVVKYEGEISDNNEINGAYSMYKGILEDGDLQIAE